MNKLKQSKTNKIIKTLLFLSLLLACTFSSNAQSDATWEETVGFINKYSKYLYSTTHCTHTISNFHITGFNMSFLDNNLKEIYNVDLSKIKIIRKDGIAIEVLLTGPYFMTKGYESSNYYFHICDSEMRERIYKAFSHLAKLATKKREAERKASGDKF